MFNKKHLFYILKYCPLACLFIVMFVISTSAASKLQMKMILPSDSALSDIKSMGESRKAEGEELYKLINGGAVIFFQYNFKRALFQEYVLLNGKTINLEIYQMGSLKNAKGIFLKKRGEEGKKLAFGQDGFLADYYCVFRQGPYYITITGEESTKAVRNTLTAIARIVAGNIKNIGNTP